MKREQIERWALQAGAAPDGRLFLTYVEDLEKFAALVAAHEREQCALVCERMFSDGALVIAEAIRARSN